MTNRPKIKGTQFETAVVNYLRDNGFPWAERRALAGNLDKGDIAGIPGICVECKNTAKIDLGGGMAELEVEMRNAGVDLGVLVVKRRMKGVAESYAVMNLSQAARLLRDEEIAPVVPLRWHPSLDTDGTDAA